MRPGGALITHRFVALALACLMGSTACSEKEAASYSGVAKLARALKANGIACEGFRMMSSGAPKPSAAPSKAGAQRLVEQRGDCTHESSRLLLFTFRSRKVRDRWLALGQLYGPLVRGPNWAVSSQNKDVVEEIGGALGGEVTGGDVR